MSKRGVSVFELLVAVSIFSLMIILSVPGVRSFFCRIQLNNGLRAITSALNAARYRAIHKNRRVKLTIKNNQVILMEKRGEEWQTVSSTDLGDKVSASINSSPVFSPCGSVSPLCSIHVKNEKHHYKITLSIAGRLKVSKIEP